MADAAVYNPESIDGVVEIADSLYAKSPESLSRLNDYLRGIGFDVRDISGEADVITKAIAPRELLEREGRQLWHAKLGEPLLQRKGVCGSCKSLIDINRIETHNHKCESCGDYTYVEFQKGGLVKFSLVDDDSMDSYTLVCHSYDARHKRLRFYCSPADSILVDIQDKRLLPSVRESYSALDAALKRFPETFTASKSRGTGIVSVPHDAGDCRLKAHGINISSNTGNRRNYTAVKVFNGREYDEMETLPVPQSVPIYESWHWSPLPPGPDLYKKVMEAAGQVSRKDFYYQDGRPAFDSMVIGWMLKFISEFTTVDAKTVEEHLTPDLSGPGLIDVLAKFTGNAGYIETRPNIGNTFAFFGKVLGGENPTDNEFIAAVDGTNDSKQKGILDDILGKGVAEKTFEAFSSRRGKGRKS